MKYATSLLLFTVVVASLCATAFGHPGHSHAEPTGGGLIAGLLHPLLGMDHLLAMVTVGLLSAQIGSRAMWLVPGSFLACMIIGGLVGVSGRELPAVEYGIAASIILLGTAVALNQPFHLALPIVLAGIFGVFHGHAHGTEMPHIASPALYATGFVASTLALHILGVIVGSFAVHSVRGATALRLAGAAIAIAGIWFAVSV